MPSDRREQPSLRVQGYSLRTAGDVNGDGYSDVIIAAYYYDDGQTDEGRVLVYHGSSGGLGSTRLDRRGQPGQRLLWHLGEHGRRRQRRWLCRCHHRGPVLRQPRGDEGAAFVWYGSSTGLGIHGTPANADWTAESNQAKRLFRGLGQHRPGMSTATATPMSSSARPTTTTAARLTRERPSSGTGPPPAWGPMDGTGQRRLVHRRAGRCQFRQRREHCG